MSQRLAARCSTVRSLLYYFAALTLDRIVYCTAHESKISTILYTVYDRINGCVVYASTVSG